MIFFLVSVALGAPDTVSLFEDLALMRGFRLSAVRSSLSPVEVGVVLSGRPEEPPVWRLAQWGTRFSLESTAELVAADGQRMLANAGKTVKVLPGGLAGQGVLLAVHGLAEYDGALRQYGEPWPHLLIEQRLDAVPLSRFSRLEFSLALRIDSCIPLAGASLDPGLHTAHVNAFWTLHNKNEASADFNGMIWFGLPLFDARYPVPPGHQALDVGQPDATGKFIYSVEGARLWRGPVAMGQWHKLSCDLLPLAREALEAAQRHGHLAATRAEDLAMTSFNLGWEVPGPYDCSVTLRGLDLRGTLIRDP